MASHAIRKTTANFHADALCDLTGVLITPTKTNAILELAIEPIKDIVRTSGAVVFKGFNLDVGQFEQFSNSLSNDFMNNKGSGSVRETQNLNSDGTIQNVAYRYRIGKQQKFPLPLHADRAYVKSRPEVMFFMCEKPADSDGETTVCDGIAVYHALSDSTRKLLDEKRLKYIRHYTESEWQTLYQTDDFAVVEAYCRDNDMTLERTDDNGIHTAFIQSAVPPTKWQGVPSFCNSLLIGLWQEYDLGRKTTFVRFEDDSEITPALRQELEEVSERLTANVPWEAGDIAIVDNTRMLHGRRAFTDDDRAVLARMCRSVSW